MTAGLGARFGRAVAAVGGSNASNAIFRELLDRYAEPHRHYHTLEHVEACLRWLDRARDVAEHPDEIELALWFHDAVYVIGDRENERHSAELARARLSALGVGEVVIDRVVRHVLATEKHGTGTGDTALTVDIDLSILGARADVFDGFEERIRREYAVFSDAAYAEGRARVLRAFSSRPRIYVTAPLHDALEAPARGNLERRLRELSVPA